LIRFVPVFSLTKGGFFWALGRIKLKIDLIRNQCLKNPKLETPADMITIASADTMEAALRIAVEDMIELINPYPTIRVSTKVRIVRVDKFSYTCFFILCKE
jgi:hypothetical protein